MALAGLPSSRFVVGASPWPRIQKMAPRQVRRFRVNNWIEEVQEGYQEVSSSLEGLPKFMHTLRRSPAARRFLSGLIVAVLLAWSWAPVGSLVYLAMKPEDWWQGTEVTARLQHLEEVKAEMGESQAAYVLHFFLDKVPLNGGPSLSDLQALAPALFGNVLSGSTYAALFDTAAALPFFYAGRILSDDFRRRHFAKNKIFSRQTLGSQDESPWVFLYAAQRLAEEEGLRLALLLRLLSVGSVDALLCAAVGSLGMSPQQFALGHLIACWRSSIEYACLGATIRDHSGAEVELVILLQLLLAIASGAVVTACAVQMSDQLLNRAAARSASSWPSVEAIEVQRSVPQVELQTLEEPPREPCLVLGYKVPFPLQSLDDLRSSRYPCPQHPVLMMYSPSGVFSSYPVEREVVQHGDGLRFADGSEERPAHVHRMEAFQDAVAHMREEQSCDIQFSLDQAPTKYFRQGFPERQRNETLQKIGLKPADFSDFSTYCSDRHSLTNFHFDQHPGCLQMCSGRKQVLLVHPRFSSYMRSFVEDRRSWITSEIQAVTVPHWNIILNPGDCLFIPAGFWHQVKSLDSPTLGTVLRYK